MTTPSFYRGGANLVPRRFEVRFDRATGLVRPERGVSVSTSSNGLERFGGAHEVVSVPQGLEIVQTGKDPHHHEIIPATMMSFDEYSQLLQQVTLVPV